SQMSDTVAVSQLGARMHYAVPRIFHEAGELEILYTDICVAKGWPRLLTRLPERMLPTSLRRLAARNPKDIPPHMLSCFQGLGLAASLSRMLVRSGPNETATALFAGRRFSAGVVQRGFGAAAGFYGISGECLEQLQAARAAGLWTAVEQIIAPREVVDRLVAAEAARFPGWEECAGRDPYAADFAAREKAEWSAADLIVCPS